MSFEKGNSTVDLSAGVEASDAQLHSPEPVANDPESLADAKEVLKRDFERYKTMDIGLLLSHGLAALRGDVQMRHKMLETIESKGEKFAGHKESISSSIALAQAKLDAVETVAAYRAKHGEMIAPEDAEFLRRSQEALGDSQYVNRMSEDLWFLVRTKSLMQESVRDKEDRLAGIAGAPIQGAEHRVELERELAKSKNDIVVVDDLITFRLEHGDSLE